VRYGAAYLFALSVSVTAPPRMRPRQACAPLTIRPAQIRRCNACLGSPTATLTHHDYGHLYPDQLDQMAQQMGAKCPTGAYRSVTNNERLWEVETASSPVSTSFSSTLARLAQRESASLTRKRSLVQSQYRAPMFVQLDGRF
jgi:hypothetical protein